MQSAFFPACPPAVLTRAGVATVAAVLGLATVALLLRQDGPGALDTLYAEDGTIFLGEALRESTVDAVLSPYAGYIHAVPRIAAEVATFVPLHLSAAVLAFIASFVTAALALVVFRATAGHIRSVPVRAALAASMIFLPVAQEEVTNNVANLHWFFLFTSVWVMLWDPPSRWERAIGALVLVLAGLSDPLVIVLAPLVLLRVLHRRGLRHQLFPAAMALGLTVQVLGIVIVDAQRQGLQPTTNLPRVAMLYVFDVIGRAALGMRLLHDRDSFSGQLLVAGVVLVTAVSIALLFRRKHGSAVEALFCAMSVLFYLATVLPTGISPPRYGVVPILLLFSALACLADGLPGAVTPGALTVVRTVLVLLLVTVWAANYRIPNRRANGPRWSDEVSRAEASCVPDTAREIELRIAPGDWYVDVPCAAVGGSG